MNFDEHIQKAEGLLRLAEDSEPEAAALLVARAQVHATLAQAQATERPMAVQQPDGSIRRVSPGGRPPTSWSTKSY